MPRVRSMLCSVYVWWGTVLLGLSVLLWWNVWVAGDPGSTITCQCGDPAQYMWLMQWVPWSLGHLHDPFLSQALYAGQGGVNTLELSDLLPQLLASPVTVLAGPVAAFNVFVTLVPVLNGLSLLVFLRRVTSFVPAQLIASLLYGFSPFVIHDLPFGHFNISLLFFPPLLLWCLHDLIVEPRHRPAVTGLVLAALVIAEFFTGTEVLAMSAVLAAIGGVVVLILAPRLVLSHLKRLVVGLAVTLFVTLVVLGYPLWFALDGPRHVTGYPWPLTPYYGAPISGIVHVHAGGPSVFNETGGYFGSLASSASLGLLPVVAAATAVLAWRRRRAVWCTVVMGAVAWALSLGVKLWAPRDYWLPWRLFFHLPVISEVVPLRFSSFTDLAVAILVALAVDFAWATREGVARAARLTIGTVHRRASRAGSEITRRPANRGPGLAWGMLCCSAALATMVPIARVYRPFTVHDVPVPQWFRAVAPSLPPGTTVLALPDPSSGANQAMAWQAEDDLDFSLVGGEATVPGPDGTTSIHDDPPVGAALMLNELSSGSKPEPVPTPAVVRSVRSALASWGVDVVAVTEESRDPAYAVGFLTAVLGRPPSERDLAFVWDSLSEDPSLTITTPSFRSCVDGRSADPESAALCVVGSTMQEQS